jgi:hypothetical protein
LLLLLLKFETSIAIIIKILIQNTLTVHQKLPNQPELVTNHALVLEARTQGTQGIVVLKDIKLTEYNLILTDVSFAALAVGGCGASGGTAQPANSSRAQPPFSN